jgi:hypothetical protein
VQRIKMKHRWLHWGNIGVAGCNAAILASVVATRHYAALLASVVATRRYRRRGALCRHLSAAVPSGECFAAHADMLVGSTVIIIGLVVQARSMLREMNAMRCVHPQPRHHCRKGTIT